MKKYLMFIVLISFLITGCFNKKTNDNENSVEEITTVCSGKQNIKEDVSVDTEYEIKSKDGKVITLISTEIITSNDTEYLNTTKEDIEKTYSIYKDINNYEYNITLENNKLISKTKINYEKVDLKKLIEVDPANENVIVNDSVNLKTLKDMYESLGNKCN